MGNHRQKDNNVRDKPLRRLLALNNQANKQGVRMNAESNTVNQTVNAMDAIEVRPLSFDVSEVEKRSPVWSRSHPLFSIYINALGLHVPYFERFLVKGLRKHRDHIDNAQLKSDVSKIIGQEAHHAKNFVALNALLAERYPGLAKVDTEAREFFEDALEAYDKRELLGLIAGYETFTFLGGLIILENYDEWMKDADPVMRSLWVWHQVEEVEHGSVAFDAFRYFYPEDEWYRKWMILKAFTHIGRETWRAYLPMIRGEGYLKSWSGRGKALGFFLKFSYLLARSALPTLRRDYHPRNHPACSTMRSPVAISWTEYYSSGGDVLSLDNAAMSAMLAGD